MRQLRASAVHKERRLQTQSGGGGQAGGSHNASIEGRADVVDSLFNPNVAAVFEQVVQQNCNSLNSLSLREGWQGDGNPILQRLFAPFRCSAWLIFIKSTMASHPPCRSASMAFISVRSVSMIATGVVGVLRYRTTVSSLIIVRRIDACRNSISKSNAQLLCNMHCSL